MSSVICAPLFEEFIFRHAPLQIVKKYKLFEIESIVVVFSCIVFGWYHYYGFQAVLLQGVIGLVLCWVYIKNGYSYWSSVCVHSAYNLILFLTDNFVFPS